MATRPQIGIFGRRNAGKSSFINVLSGQEVAIVSPIPGTTTDPVRKTMELPGMGPIVLIDTAGMDDQGLLGDKRVLKSREVILQVNLAVLLFTGNYLGQYEKELIDHFRNHEVPFLLVHNKADRIPLEPEIAAEIQDLYPVDLLDFSCKEPENIETLLALIQKNLGPSPFQTLPMMGSLVNQGDTVVLVCPIDSEAPQGRLILPQVQVLRELLDRRAIAVALQETQLEAYLAVHPQPKLVVTDSQLFGRIEHLLAPDQDFTSFSILLSRAKGNFAAYAAGTSQIDHLQDGDHILLLEACSHHATCEDIGRVKLPKMLRHYTGKTLHFDLVSGLDAPKHPLNHYALLIQCGGCMITQRQVLARIKEAHQAGVPITNYGMAISYTQGVFSRAVAPFEK